MKRTYWYSSDVDQGQSIQARGEGTPSTEAYDILEDREEVPFAEANLVSSMCKPATIVGDVVLDDAIHKPALDLDIDAQLVPRRTPGHHHLYINKELSWTQYSKLLDVLAECGIIEENYASVSKARGMTFLRKGPLKGEPRA